MNESQKTIFPVWSKDYEDYVNILCKYIRSFRSIMIWFMSSYINKRIEWSTPDSF